MKNLVLALAIATALISGCSVPDYTQDSKQQQVNRIAEYIATHDIDAQQSESGLFYAIKNEGGEEKPTPEDTVLVHYKGSLLNGDVFESTMGGAPTKIHLQKAIKGWQEGIPKLGRKGRAVFIIPPYLAYGDKRVGEIPNDATLVFELYLVDF